MTRTEIALVLAPVPIFQGFTQAMLKTVASYVSPMAGHAGDVLFVEGAPATGLFVVGSGRCSTSVAEGDVRAGLGELGPGESFGEYALIVGGQHRLTVTADEDVTLFHLSIQAFGRLRAEHPDVGYWLILGIARHLGNLLDRLSPVLKRVALRELNP